jgi:HAMP domain-containing protein
VARPLREQFAIATLILLVPVGAVMTLAASQVYIDQMQQLKKEADGFAQTIAAHMEVVGPDGDISLREYVRRLPLPDDSTVSVKDENEKGAGGFSFTAPSQAPGVQELERTYGLATIRGRPLVVSVGIPAVVALYRTKPNAQKTILISGLATLILLLMQVVFLRRWLPALSSLERSAAKVGAGDLSPPPSVAMPSRELEHLRDGFHDMVNRLRTAREAIARQVEEERGMRL